MQTKSEQWTVAKLANLYGTPLLSPNEEYQRGLEWTNVQQQKFVDSIFRGYPVPPIFLHEIQGKDAHGREYSTHEIIDGLQRLDTLHQYRKNKWVVPSPDPKKFPLPTGVVQGFPRPPWADRTYDALPDGARKSFDETTIEVILIVGVHSPDEVRDLFIRLQAGTALTRQQVRDAWPGPISRYVVGLAGKKDSKPKIDLFSWIGRWGRRLPEDLDPEEDVFLEDRQTCAQLLRIFLARESLPVGGRLPSMPPIAARSLDDMYHTQTDFLPTGPSAQRFERILRNCQEAITQNAPEKSRYVRKNELFSLFCFFQDATRHPNAAVTEPFVRTVGEAFWKQADGEPSGKVTSSEQLEQHYVWFTTAKLGDLNIPWLDPRRTFPEEMKELIWERASKAGGGIVICAICNNPVSRKDAEFDHKTAWILGGPTTPDNGRVLHGPCNRSLGGAISGVSR